MSQSLESKLNELCDIYLPKNMPNKEAFKRRILIIIKEKEEQK